MVELAIRAILFGASIGMIISQVDSGNITTKITTTTTTAINDKMEDLDDNKNDNAELHDFDWPAWCKMQSNGNDCTSNGVLTPTYYYDTLLGDCKTFNYGQCKFNINGFSTLSECRDSCRDAGPEPLPSSKLPPKIFCFLQPDFGHCDGYFPMFYYDITTKSCHGFSYSGCGGNANRFSDQRLCSNTCNVILKDI